MNRLSNIATNKRKFKDPKPKHEFKPRINKKSIKMAEKRKTKILNLVEFGVSSPGIFCNLFRTILTRINSVALIGFMWRNTLMKLRSLIYNNFKVMKN